MSFSRPHSGLLLPCAYSRSSQVTHLLGLLHRRFTIWKKTTPFSRSLTVSPRPPTSLPYLRVPMLGRALSCLFSMFSIYMASLRTLFLTIGPILPLPRVVGILHGCRTLRQSLFRSTISKPTDNLGELIKKWVMLINAQSTIIDHQSALIPPLGVPSLSGIRTSLPHQGISQLFPFLGYKPTIPPPCSLCPGPLVPVSIYMETHPFCPAPCLYTVPAAGLPSSYTGPHDTPGHRVWRCWRRYR